MDAAAAPRSKEASSPRWSFTQPSRKPAMKVSPAPTVSTTVVGKPGTRVMLPPGSMATPPPGPSVITASPSPYCSTHVPASSTGSPPFCLAPLASAVARNLMSSSLALTIPCRRPTTRSQGCTLLQ